MVELDHGATIVGMTIEEAKEDVEIEMYVCSTWTLASPDAEGYIATVLNEPTNELVEIVTSAGMVDVARDELEMDAVLDSGALEADDTAVENIELLLATPS